MNATDDNANVEITAQRAPVETRPLILPKHFGRYFMAVENLIFEFARTLVPDYHGGYWHFYELSNQGFYMAPESRPMRVCVETNGFEGEMSGDAIGVTVCLFAFSHGSFRYSDDTFAHHYELLREFSYSHPEAGLISAATD